MVGGSGGRVEGSKGEKQGPVLKPGGLREFKFAGIPAETLGMLGREEEEDETEETARGEGEGGKGPNLSVSVSGLGCLATGTGRPCHSSLS